MTNREKLGTFVVAAFNLGDMVESQSEAIISQTLVDDETVSIAVFAFDEGERFSEHSAPHDAILQVVDGNALITIEGGEYEVRDGESIVLPASRPHAVGAVSIQTGPDDVQVDAPETPCPKTARVTG